MSAFADIQSQYDVKGVCDAITKFGFDIVVLQFPDENLADATNVYTAIKGSIRDSIELYITADSTYGSSVDDVSALHVHCKLLVYFGSDMSVSGSMPVLVCPKRLHIDTAKAADVIAAEVSTAIAGGEDAVSVLVFLEPAYFNCLDAVQASVTTAVASHRVTVAFGSRPACVDLTTWDPANTRNTEAIATHELIGGMLVPRDRTVSEKDLVVIIGDKNDQIINICLRYSGSKIICYSPSANACSTKLGVELKEYRERYLGVMRVQDASVIGLIIGSMGLSGDVIQSTVNGLKKLVKAAGKKSYVLVMGRLNEAKLRNFPEIDMFCLVSNDDTSLISPKTFHIPVITPFELELGLGAREWDSTYVVGGFVGSRDAASNGGDISFAQMLERVKLNRPEDAIDESSDEETTDAVVGGSDATAADTSTALTTSNTEKRITNHFVSAGADFLKTREFQGLDYAVPADQSLEAVPGQCGTASGYRHMSSVDDTPSSATCAVDEKRA